MDLLREWAVWEPGDAPYILESDRRVLESPHKIHRAWSEAYSDPAFCKPGDRLLHLGLLPQPFFGDLRKATIYILLLNPGLGPHDYYGEYEVPEYRRALLANLKQEFSVGSIPFLFLDPQYAWHGGFKWWHGKFASVIEQLAKKWDRSFADARAQLGKRLASVELVPYHSVGFRDSGGIRKLHSAALARAFVHDVVIPRVKRGEAITILTRQAEKWGLPKHRGVIRYTGQEARAAHLSPGSRGGLAIMEHLAKIPL